LLFAWTISIRHYGSAPVLRLFFPTRLINTNNVAKIIP